MTSPLYHIPHHWTAGDTACITTVSVAMRKYLDNTALDSDDMEALRGYFHDFVIGDDLDGPGMDALRNGVPYVVNRETADDWVTQAIAIGVCPL